MAYALLQRESKANHTAGRKPSPSRSAGGLLRLGSPSDPAEREADEVAARALRAPPAHAETVAPRSAPSRAPSGEVVVRRKCAACEQDEPTIRRKCAACEQDDEPTIRRSPTAPGGPEVSPALHRRVTSLHREGGRPLPQPVRADMESRFGRDFSGVRIHQNPRAAELAEQLNARAFTVGPHIAFARDQFAPARPEGRRLLAHELVHTLQHDRRAPLLARAVAGPDVEKEMTEVIGMRAEQTGKVVACDPLVGRAPGDVMRAHSLAVRMTATAYNALPAAPDLLVPGGAQVSRRVRELARLWFQLEWPAHDDRETALWQHMISGVRALHQGGPSTRYKCSPCNQAGLVLPGSPFVRLCDGWWETTSLNKRAAIIVHEWGHFWGGRAGLMRRVFESYCGKKHFNAMASAKLVQMPDAYMGFIYELGLNSVLTPDFVCEPYQQLHPGDD